ncbi:hypothetical protein N7G274_004561 [Stereocaulon virgatum]|uniref:Uncharacterized protein n=1 Tax=Stereocaulon virgatum TaxID=373712 RepID=A0ABR4AA99_9LECA
MHVRLRLRDRDRQEQPSITTAKTKSSKVQQATRGSRDLDGYSIGGLTAGVQISCRSRQFIVKIIVFIGMAVLNTHAHERLVDGSKQANIPKRPRLSCWRQPHRQSPPPSSNRQAKYDRDQELQRPQASQVFRRTIVNMQSTRNHDTASLPKHLPPP